ncbi:hypothetical protein ACWXWE_22405 [Pantoea ananatis]|nr:hypothetical protein KR94_05925 [Pantoea ananatis]PZD60266.1 hypothetical protein ARC272_18705 [Pantoea ananatis]
MSEIVVFITTLAEGTRAAKVASIIRRFWPQKNSIGFTASLPLRGALQTRAVQYDVFMKRRKKIAEVMFDAVKTKMATKGHVEKFRRD